MNGQISTSLSSARWWALPPRRPVSTLSMQLGVCAWIATIGNIALWKHLKDIGLLSGTTGWLMGAGLALFVLGLLSMLVAALSWRWTFKPALVVLLALTAASAHFSLNFGTIMDPSMMTNVLQTNPAEALDLLGFDLLSRLLLLTGLPGVWVLIQPVSFVDAGKAWRQNLKVGAIGLASALLAILICFQSLASTMRNHREVRYLINPLNVIYSMGTVLVGKSAHSMQVQAIGQDAAIQPHLGGQRPPPLLILVLGETARSGNFGVNGYARPTTPQLASEDVVSFRNAWSCGTSTAASVPCMFSRMTRKHFFDRDHEEEGVLDVLQRAGYGVLWVDNQSGCKGVCDRVPSATVDASANPALCHEGECLDEAMLSGLDERILALPAERRAKGVVVVLHQMGSHGPAYFRRSPTELKRFLPECTSALLQDCTRTELLNAYDNSVVYTDRMLGQTIHWLKGQEGRWRPAMIYLADHGESLGENNLYLHGLPYAIAPDVQKHVPWLSWMSPQFREGAAIDWACLGLHRDTEVSHDNLFHSLLGLMAVKTSVYDRALDAYAPCRPS